MGCSEDAASTASAGPGGSTTGPGTGGTGGSGGASTGGGTTGGGGAVPDGFVIAFPPPSSITDAPSITVNGTASLDGDIDAITVAGVAATSEDGFAHWAASVPLSVGSQTLSVEVVVDGDAQALGSVTVDRREALMFDPTIIALDTAGDRAFVAAGIYGLDNVIYEIDLTTGAQRVVSSLTVGSGPISVLAHRVAYHAGNAWLSSLVPGVTAVDLASGNRTVLADDMTGSGPLLLSIKGLAHDGTSVLAIDAQLDAVIRIDPSTAVRTIASGYFIGSGEELDPDTGARSELSGLDVGTGPAIVSPGTGILEGSNLYIGSASGWLRVDLVTGDRTPISEPTDLGPLRLQIGFAISDTGLLLSTDNRLGALLATDRLTGERVIVSR